MNKDLPRKKMIYIMEGDGDDLINKRLYSAFTLVSCQMSGVLRDRYLYFRDSLNKLVNLWKFASSID